MYDKEDFELNFEDLSPEEQDAIWDSMLPNMTEDEREEYIMDLE